MWTALGTPTQVPPLMINHYAAGVDPERLAALSRLGFSGAAMLGAVWQAPDPLHALKTALATADRI